MRRSILISLLCLVVSAAVSGPHPFNGFVENKGQWEASVKFRKKVPDGFLFLNKTGWTYYLSHAWNAHKGHADPGMALPLKNDFEETTEEGLSQVITTSFVGANAHTALEPLYPQSYYHNFLPGDSLRRASHVGEYDEVLYCNLYDNVDLRMTTTDSGIKYDLMVAPCGNPGQIAMEWEGCGDLYLENGNLVIETEFGRMVEQKPYAYQLTGAGTVEVAAEFAIQGRRVSFTFPSGYNTAHPLIIDPLLIFSTYSGSSSDNWGNTATFDHAGNTYAGGIIFGASAGVFVPKPGVFQEKFGGDFDAVLMKFDSAGSQLLFTTYLGGSLGETPVSLIVNSKGELVVLGATSSSNFPVSNNAFQRQFGGGIETDPFADATSTYVNGSDIFISVLSGDGTSLVASTLLGGSNNDGMLDPKSSLVLNYGDQLRGEVHLDENDNIYIASTSYSPDIPMNNKIHDHAGSSDGILVKMSAGLSQMLWGTYLGGSEADAAFSVKPSPSGGVFAAGGTVSQSFQFPVNGWQQPAGLGDGYVVYIDETVPAVSAATFLGSADTDQAYLLDLDLAGNVYVLGQTKGNYPVTGDVYSNPGSGQFLHKLNASLSATIWSTVFGSGTLPSNISPTAFLVSNCNNIYIAGWGGSVNTTVNMSVNYGQGTTLNMPVTADAAQPVTDGADFYLMVLEPDARALLYATYFGGNPGRDHVDGGTSRFDKQGVVHHSVCAGCADRNSRKGVFPTTSLAWSEVNNSPNCNLGVFKFDLSTLAAGFSTNTPDLQNPEVRQGCVPFTFLFTNKSTGGESYFWNLGDGTVSTNPDTVIHSYEQEGEYVVTLTATNRSACKNSDLASKKIILRKGTYTLSPPAATICYGDRVELQASGGTSYYWLPRTGLSSVTISNPVASPQTSTTYYVTISNETNGCTFEDSLRIEVLEEMTTLAEVKAVYTCEGVSEYHFDATVSGAPNAFWDFGDGSQTNELSANHIYPAEGTYTTKLVVSNKLCSIEETEEVRVAEMLIPNAFTPNGDGINDRFEIKYTEPLSVTILERNGTVILEETNYTSQWDGGKLPGGIYYYRVTLPDGTYCNGWVHLIR